MKDENGNSANFAFKAKSAKYTDCWEEYSGNFTTVEDAKKWYFDSQRGGMLRQLFQKELVLAEPIMLIVVWCALHQRQAMRVIIPNVIQC